MDKFVRANYHYWKETATAKFGAYFFLRQEGIQNFDSQISCQVFPGHEVRRQALNFNAVSLRVHLDIRWSAQMSWMNCDSCRDTHEVEKDMIDQREEAQHKRGRIH